MRNCTGMDKKSMNEIANTVVTPTREVSKEIVWEPGWEIMEAMFNNGEIRAVLLIMQDPRHGARTYALPEQSLEAMRTWLNNRHALRTDIEVMPDRQVN